MADNLSTVSVARGGEDDGTGLIGQLPNELIKQIFYYCSGKEEVQNLALTNKLLYSIFDAEMELNLDRLRLGFLNGRVKKESRLSRLLELYNSNNGEMLTYDQYFVDKNLMYKEAYTDRIQVPSLDAGDEEINREDFIKSMLCDIPASRNMKLNEDDEDNEKEDEEKEDKDSDEEEEAPKKKKRKLSKKARKRFDDEDMNDDEDEEQDDEEGDSDDEEEAKVAKAKKGFEANTLNEFKTRINKLLKKNTLAATISNIIFEFNKSSNIKFIIAGGFVLHCITGCSSCDIDIFCINNGEDDKSVDIAFKKVLAIIEKKLKEESIEYRVLKTNGTLNIMPKISGERTKFQNKYPDSSTPDNKLGVQFVLRRVASIEELMCFFDIDACRFSFDGEKVYTILEGLRALQYNMNFIGREHISTILYYDRAIKYSRRGFGTFSVDFHHPLQHRLHIQPFVTWLRKFFGEHYFNDDPQVIEDDPYYSGYSNWDEYSHLAPYMFVHIYGNGDEEQNYGNRDIDEDNYYTVILRSVDYWLIDKFCNHPIRTVLSSLWEYYSDGRYINDLKKVKVEDNVDGDEELIESIATHIEKHDVHYFCKDISELLQKNQSIYITEGYLDSHLMKKYKYYKCYICGKYSHITKKKKCENTDFCSECHKFNERAKSLRRDLNDKVAIVTGARAKIGYETALLLLRMKCTVAATSRFAHNAFDKFKLEKDFNDWKDRLLVYPLNLKDGKSVMEFIEFIKKKFKHIDIIINNAAQTVRRPVTYYQPLIEIELKNCDSPLPLSLPTENKDVKELQVLSNNLIEQTIRCTKETSLPEDLSYIPTSEKDKFGEFIDKRKLNSWNQSLTDTSTIELVEAQMINNVAPTLIVSNLQGVMTPDYDKADGDSNPNDSLALGYSFIINVSSHEGQFNTTGKTDNHIHTNTSKASLNMLTRSGANQFAKSGILMNSVDTGWVSSAIKTFKDPVLNCEDAAYRILYPILSGSLDYGKLYKDYKVVDW
ncbi:hypothetical protein NAEGRDRAFT_58420 [Naegleria gruberi]|uniref:F-box domain-containing protein n=1 Tax=Naegleria gruberi TaxID=5762 RepID=D2VJT2_NAEGR|nr:uncharacterized protein NAEGRDRAFT_58420 [Naegleria gruberi]EFC43006.1 hypothetical protein NAEGRDRAFT_58420 [Naegleria gruberi]|eukprot:XP_002675750.1 hypothetical protein NAEGRDRAFT_58420 [Naegleria gruberi strain NEG-M]